MMRTSLQTVVLALSLPLAVALALGIAPAASAQVVFDFENLTPGKAAGQRGWTSGYSSGAGASIVAATNNSANRSQVLTADQDSYEQLMHVFVGSTAPILRFTGLETDAYIQMDWRYEALHSPSGIGMTIGRDLDADGGHAMDNRPGLPMEGIGIRIQHGRFHIINDNFGPSGSRLLLDTGGVGDWYRLRLTMDFTAGNGVGHGTLEYLNLTRGDTMFRPVTEGPLDLDRLGAGAEVPFWNSIAVMVTWEAEIDNITIGSSLRGR